MWLKGREGRIGGKRVYKEGQKEKGVLLEGAFQLLFEKELLS